MKSCSFIPVTCYTLCLQAVFYGEFKKKWANSVSENIMWGFCDFGGLVWMHKLKLYDMGKGIEPHFLLVFTHLICIVRLAAV